MPKIAGILAAAAGAVLLAVALFSYLALPGLIEGRVAEDLRKRYGLPSRPEVEVSSDFPPKLLLGRADRIEVRMDRLGRGGVRLRDVRVDLRDVNVSVLGLLSGNLEREIRKASLRAEAPEKAINEYLRSGEMGLEGWEVVIRRGGEVVYRNEDALAASSAGVGLDLRVAGPLAVGVAPDGAQLAGLALPGSVADQLSSLDFTLDLGELPFGAELESVEPSEGTVVVRAAS